jgi:hypothetical protein
MTEISIGKRQHSIAVGSYFVPCGGWFGLDPNEKEWRGFAGTARRLEQITRVNMEGISTGEEINH